MKKNKIININPKEEYRIVAISDIHAHLDIFKSLLKKINLKVTDYLIIIGDFINKGPESYNTYQFIKNLSKRKNTIILKCNHEAFIYQCVTNKKMAKPFLEFLKKEEYNTIFHEFTKLFNKKLNSFKNAKDFQEYFYNKDTEFFEYINNLPIIANIDNFMFVHGDYDKSFDIHTNEIGFLKYDNFNEKSDINKKITVVGHWSTSVLRTDIHTNKPFFNNEKNIISIDGGLGVKSSGELNAFIIEKKNNHINYSWIQENNFQEKIIKKNFDFHTEEKIFVNYPNYEVELLKKGDLMSRCRHIFSGKEFSVFNSLIYKNRENYTLRTSYINNFLNLKIGDKVKLCLSFDDCHLVKYNDEFGWILKYQI